MYAEIVFDQKIATWLICHQHAFAFFQAVPRRIILDNLKAAIIRAYTQDADPAAQQSYRECAEHYGFLTPAPTAGAVSTRACHAGPNTRARSSAAGWAT